ncbi:MAG: hypothetical protein EPN93_05270 [Spirochaetes bacterium]|nr:MAG: hypothetical protein EPN93_05270 [Spirochaetota bacterium]
MKSKFFVILAALVAVFAFSYGASAQTLTTDIVFLKLGYVPVYTFEYDVAGSETYDWTGFAVAGEYNLNFDNFWLGFGLEWKRMQGDDFGSTVTGEDKYINQFLSPQFSAKFAALGGLYVGAGVEGKYLISSKVPAGGEKADKKIDLWVDGILGYYMVSPWDGVFFDLEGRFGYNLTNNQFKDKDTGDKIKSNYDVTLYVGIGYRATQSEY